MRKNLIISVLSLFTLSSFAQISFEKGFLVDNENRKTECLIKNIDWENNPKEFDYKLVENGDVLKGDLASVKSFSVYGYSKYIRADVKIDRSPDELEELSRQRNPVWSQEQLFLKVLIEGKATLYSYSERNFIRFFYSIQDTNIQQLIYKEYLADDYHTATNNDFRQQLSMYVKCDGMPEGSFESLAYQRKELEKYFLQFNECTGDTSIVYLKPNDREKFYLRVTPGINYSSLTISQYEPIEKEWDYGSSFTFRIGLDAEFIMPFNKNKWGLTVEPTFQMVNFSDPVSEVEPLKYNTLDISAGIRYYFYLKEENRLFINVYFNSFISLDSDAQLEVFNRTFEIRQVPNFAFGIGADYKRFSAEIRYYTPQYIFDNSPYWKSDLRKIAFVVAYKVFSVR
jgi:hypothetical protein